MPFAVEQHRRRLVTHIACPHARRGRVRGGRRSWSRVEPASAPRHGSALERAETGGVGSAARTRRLKVGAP